MRVANQGGIAWTPRPWGEGVIVYPKTRGREAFYAYSFR
jgi:hypothetical protein